LLGRFTDVSALAFLTATLALFGTGIASGRHYHLILALLFLSVYAVGCCAFTGHELLSRWLSWDWLRWFGNMSYSYYLAHGLVLHILNIALNSLRLPATLSPVQYLALGVASFAITVAGSVMVFLGVEKRFSLGTQVREPVPDNYAPRPAMSLSAVSSR
jgi:peptidoglycan/LPS O-acetylase OafA/YrhL